MRRRKAFFCWHLKLLFSLLYMADASFQVPIPTTPGLDPLSLLTDDATVAQWNNDGLPSDRMSTENATILTNSERWPLMIDPQVFVHSHHLLASGQI